MGVWQLCPDATVCVLGSNSTAVDCVTQLFPGFGQLTINAPDATTLTGTLVSNADGALLSWKIATVDVSILDASRFAVALSDANVTATIVDSDTVTTDYPALACLKRVVVPDILPPVLPPVVEPPIDVAPPTA